ncbi:Ig-like domain-containing protein [Candidatus Bipolaricaulota bacterium]|nr:Ig-like domain-containing protein [Candidatus Bipolaricaulota bacterium]
MSIKQLLSVFVAVVIVSFLATILGLGTQATTASPAAGASPIVIQRTPERGEEFPVDGTIELVFDRAMDCNSVEAAFSLSLRSENTSVDGAFAWIDEQTFRFKPSAPLARDATYRVYLASDARDTGGQSLNDAYTFTFRTVGYLEVTKVLPAPGTEETDADSTITVMFNRPVVPLVVVSDPAYANLPNPLAFDPAIDGSGEWLNTSIYLFTPAKPLTGGTTYTAGVAAGLTDTTGGILAEDYLWTFSTQPPDVVWISPDEGAKLAPVDTTIMITFNMPIDLASVHERFTLRRTSLLGELLAQRVEGTFDIEGNTLTFTPNEWLNFNQKYVVSLGAGITSASGGLGMLDDYTWRFTTVPLPRIISTDPRNGEKDAYPYTSFRIEFNAPIDPDTVMDNIEMEPALSPEKVHTYFRSWDNTFVLNFGAQPSSDYVVHIGPNIADPYGNTTGQRMSVRFRTAPLDPTAWLHVPGRVGTYSAYEPARMFVAYRNTKRLDLTLYRLTIDEYFKAQDDWYDFAPSSEGKLRRWSLSVKAPLNELSYIPVELTEEGGTLKPGVYCLDLRANGVSYNRWQHRHLLVVSKVNLTLKSDEHQVLVWATDLDSGAPVPGVILRAYDNDGVEYAASVTDSNGLADLPQSGKWYEITVLARKPFTLGSTQWDDGISVWEFGFNAGYLQDWRGHIYTDRPIYRPDQTVYFKGIIRAEDDVCYRLLRSGSVVVTIHDAAWELVYEETLPLDMFGSFAEELVLPTGAALGQYNIEATLDEARFSGSFQVAAYRPPEFEVTVTPDDSEIARGEATQATVDVRYFFGGAVADVPVEWNVLADDYRFQPAQFGRYTFSDLDDPWRYWRWWWRPYASPEVVLSGAGNTDANGQLMIELPENVAQLTADPSTDPPQGSRQLTVEATVYGKDGQVLSGRATIVIHRGEFYVGLAAKQSVGRADDEMSVDVVTVNWSGERLPNQELEYLVYRREWSNTYIEDEADGGHWEWESKDIEVANGRLTTSTTAEGVVTFTPPEGGSYKIIVRGHDARERTVRSSLFLWASGPETVSWRRTNDDRITLVSDKATYVPGETAEILIPSPFPGEQWALITVERGGILQREVLLLESNSTVYRLPITADHVPNIYVSVVLVQGREAALSATEDIPAVSSYKVGYIALKVEPVPQMLNVTLTPSTAQALPDSQVTCDVLVTDATGEPVRATLSLDLVDKAILTLKPRTPDAILQAFYGRRGLGVVTASGLSISINRLVAEQMEEAGKLLADEEMQFAPRSAETGAMPPSAMALEEEAERAPGSAAAQLPAGIDLREEFADTAYWNAGVVTGPDGTAQVTIELPDNLTTWVFRGVGVTIQTQVGEETTELVVTKPLLIRPVTPRFFVVGDRVKLAAIVNNNTDTLRTVEVTIAYNGLKLEGTATQRADVPAGGEAKVSWWATVKDMPYVDLAFSVVSGELSDAARPRLTTGPGGTLLVYRYTAPEIVGTGGQLTDAGSRTEVVALPPKHDDRQGELSIRLDPSLAAGMREGLDYLEHFPYECTEQIVSRFLPNVLTYRALHELGIEDKELAEKLPGLVEEGLNRLILKQHTDGGWGWWWADESSAYLTAYVVFALSKTQQVGFDVPDDVLQRGLDFLSGCLVGSRDLDSYREANRQAWILYVLAEAGHAAQASERTGDLFDVRNKLSHYARAYLALTLSLIDANDGRVQTLLSDIQNAAILSATGAHWEEEDYDFWAMNTDTRSTAVILDALAQLDPDNALIGNVVRWLMIARKDGIWETTQETAWALIALTDWMVVTGELQGRYDYDVRLNSTLLDAGHVTPQVVQEPIKLRVDVADLLSDMGNRLTISRGPGKGRLYYTAHLKVYLPVEEIEPLDRGIIVQRQYVSADCPLDEVCEGVESAAVGEMIQVRLTIVAPHDLYYVVIEDPLPAGCEAVDTSLATTSLLVQEPGLFRETKGDRWFPFYWWWWRWYSRSEMRDEKVVLFADYLPAGTYTYQYSFRATQVGTYHVIPTTANEFYFPEVFGRADGRLFTVTEEE